MTEISEFATLSNLTVFDGLEPRDRAELATEFTRIHVARGQALVRQGDAAEALYVVASGRFEVTVEGRPDAVAEIATGQPIGEIAFLAGGTRTATVRALRDSIVLELGRAAFDRLSAKNPDVWRALTVTLAHRLADSNVGRQHQPDPQPRTIALIAAGPSAIPRSFLEMLERTFKRRHRAILVDAERARGMLNGTEFASLDATEALNALEGAHDYVLYLADAEATKWSEKVIRQADLVLSVAEHRHAADWRHEHSGVPLNANECLVAQVHGPASRRLVLLHPKRQRIFATARWLVNRPCSMHHHVAMDGPEDCERLHRFIDRTALGLVACGGGAYCAAHIGLFAAFRDCGIEFDIMGGTSGGGAMTAAFAMGSHPLDIDHAIHDIFVTNRAMRRYTWPRFGLLDHHNFDTQLRKHFGTGAIEDLWIPYFAVSTNLSTRSLERHRTGKLWAAVRASGAIPALLPPYYTDDGQMLVDGALLDNVPIRVMRELKSGPNIVISFELPSEERFAIDYASLPPRGMLLRNLCNPFAQRILPDAPSPGSVLLRAMMANRNEFERYLGADDLLLVPPFPADMSILDWHRHRELFDMARTWGNAELSRLKAEGAKLFRPAPLLPEFA